MAINESINRGINVREKEDDATPIDEEDANNMWVTSEMVERETHDGKVDRRFLLDGWLNREATKGIVIVMPSLYTVLTLHISCSIQTKSLALSLRTAKR